METLGKCLALLLIISLATAIFFVFTPTGAQSVAKPSVPEFTIKYVDRSYDIPPTYGIDSYNGHNVTIQAGNHVQNKSIEVSIENQPFTPYTDSAGNTLLLWYDVRWKGHFGDYWYDTNSSGNSQTYLEAYSCLYENNVLRYPNAPITKVTLGFTNNNGSNLAYNIDYQFRVADLSVGGQIDFQVQAFIGYYSLSKINYTVQPFMDSPEYSYTFHGESSGWSDTQELTYNGSTFLPSSISPTASVNPGVNGDEADSITLPIGIFAVIIAGVIIAAVAITVLLLRKRRWSPNV